MSWPHVASAGASSLGCPPAAAEEPDPKLLTWCVGCTHTGRHFRANFPTWAPELKSNTRLTLGRRLVVLALPGRVLLQRTGQGCKQSSHGILQTPSRLLIRSLVASTDAVVHQISLATPFMAHLGLLGSGQEMFWEHQVT